jgi:RNA polymerase sigma factor (sigma-70 family)
MASVRRMTTDESIEGLYRDLWAPLLRTAWMMCRSREDAEDIVHDAFVRFVTTEMSNPDNPLAYLRKIVVNLVRDNRRRQIVALRHAPSPAAPVLPAEDAALWELVQRLPLRQRQALVLHYFDDLRFVEVADLLGCSVSSVKSLIHRGLETLREQGGSIWTA